MAESTDQHGLATGTWRQATPADVPWMLGIAAKIHAAYPEDEAVFAERLALYPEGCHVLIVEGWVVGYMLSHPWRLGDPPMLNSLLGALPDDPDTYYLHDLALLTEARGAGAGAAIVAALAEQARSEGLPTMSLVAVHESVAFWRQHEFAVVEDLALTRKLRSYDQQAQFMVRPLA